MNRASTLLAPLITGLRRYNLKVHTLSNQTLTTDPVKLTQSNPAPTAIEQFRIVSENSIVTQMSLQSSFLRNPNREGSTSSPSFLTTTTAKTRALLATPSSLKPIMSAGQSNDQSIKSMLLNNPYLKMPEDINSKTV